MMDLVSVSDVNSVVLLAGRSPARSLLEACPGCPVGKHTFPGGCGGGGIRYWNRDVGGRAPCGVVFSENVTGKEYNCLQLETWMDTAVLRCKVGGEERTTAVVRLGIHGIYIYTWNFS